MQQTLAETAPSNTPLANPDVKLDDKYRKQQGRIFVSGTQALARLPIQQRMRDAAEGKNTGGYISGYRGSPLGRYDMDLWQAKAVLKEHNIVFQPGMNEDLAATAIWGSQHVGNFPGARVDGVFGIWYGKGPGVDRSVDALRHANTAGTSPLGGVIALAGDDHGAKSSTIANFSDQLFIATGMPVLYPSNTQELLDFGLHGIAMSRFSGCWVGMKVVTDVVEGGGTIRVAPDWPPITLPPVPSLPAPNPFGAPSLNIRTFDMPLIGEDRLYNHKLAAVMAYARANGLNRVTHAAAQPRLAIVAAGKAYQDVLQAVMELGWDDAQLAAMGIRIAKVGMLWPLDPEFVREAAQDAAMLVVVEEKRPLLEDQIKSILYDLGLPIAPKVIGKSAGAPTYGGTAARVFPNNAEISPLIVAKVLTDLLRQLDPACGLAPITLPGPKPPQPQRNASFCSGCPHNRSTKVVDGSRALAGIGCHTIAMLLDPKKTGTVSQMGGEGVMWLGQSPFTDESHVFANMGDGTYFHSGFLAIRQAIAGKVNMTYKLLVNGFVSMTGGQPIDGDLGIPQTIAELLAEGVREIALVSDEPEKYQGSQFGPQVSVHHRDNLEAVQLHLRTVQGVTVMIYEQPCATERRRLRKRGKWADPAKRSFINAAVCEGCGDCSTASNCLSIEPLETPLGRKRQINQSSCNKDYTCVEGFCPSFVTVHGGTLRKPVKAGAGTQPALPVPPMPDVQRPTRSMSVLVAGIGGTGVVTIGQILGMAAHIDGLACSILDITGLSQKYGAVLSHVHIAADASQLHATRIAPGQADTVIGCDLIVSAGDEALSRMQSGRTRAVVCTDVIPTSDFSRNPDWSVDGDAMLKNIQAACGDAVFAANGIELAKALLGDSVAANMFMLGAAWQRGWIPVSLAALDRAIELNGTQVEFNRNAFLWGRRAATDLASVRDQATPTAVVKFVPRERETLAQLTARHAKFLAEYDGVAYAQRYRSLVERVAALDSRLKAHGRLAQTVAISYFKLLAIKDEWEVARLYTSDAFAQQLQSTFEGDFKLHFHLGAWPFARKDAVTGKVRKTELGPWVMSVFKLMNTLRGLRGSWLDPFRNNAERQLAHRLLDEFEHDIEDLLAQPGKRPLDLVLKLAALPQTIRGYGHVREAAAQKAAAERAELLAAPVEQTIQAA
ncbi:indolepyruvate ferredoxin oxidoreductase family protein [Acidovorax sp. D2M1]|uniref:Indolepyruvate ferredoxin oxidoreductase family protein n=1 Tax=Acidovorax benzenivorans TaxID=2987520 RepID=A0ABT5S3D8_9BURK|nr:indolepyruvate ferredoxin oxidoreductase family protein [Acidovorax benzenivorans]MDD2180484.1 indolepyruvate ferredoxin oxidoreductase family protein [Acidovorax benzenivorans]